MAESQPRPTHPHQSTRPSTSGDDALGTLSGGPAFGPPAAEGELGRLAGYRVLKLLGKGGMGEVYLAFDESLRRKVALKILPPQHASPAARERFLREARAAAAVKNDHVVTIYQVGEDRGVPFIAMEFLQGYPLDDYLKRKGRLSVPQALRVGLETAEGLAAAHALGLVHRDIKPANLWLEAPKGRIKILDFGLAKSGEASGSAAALTVEGAILGTPAFMSPEQGRGEAIDHRTDLFGLGAVLYLLTTGRYPFEGPTVMAVMVAAATHEPSPVASLNPEVPPPLAELIHRLMAKHPDARPRSAAEVADALRAMDQGPANPALVSVAQPQVVYVPIQVTAYEQSAFDNTAFENLEGMQPEVPAPTERARRASRGGFPAWAVVAVLLLAAAGAAGAFYLLKKPADVVKNQPADPPPETKPGPKPNPPKPKVADTPDRRLAEWLISKGGSVNIENGPQAVGVATALPPGAFRVTTAYTSNNGYAITDDDLDHFCDTGVDWYALGIGHKVTDRGLEKLTGFPNPERVRVFELVSRDVTDAGYLHLARFSNLEGLHLTNAKIGNAGLAVCRQLPKLKNLTLRKTDVTDAGMEHLAGAKLTNLDLFDTKVGNDGAAALGRIATLEQLMLARTRVTDDGVRHLAALKNLKVLHLGGTAVGDGGMEALAGLPLTGLTVTHTKVTDAGLGHLARVKTLNLLELRGTSVTTPGVKQFQAAVPKCQVDWDDEPNRKLARWVIENRGTVSVSGQTESVRDVEKLPSGLFKVLKVVVGESFSDADVGRFEGSDVYGVFASRHRLTNDGLEAWSKLPGAAKLTTLHLHSDRITDDGLVHLKGFKTLGYLGLSHTPVTAKGLEHVAGMGLILLNLSHTKAGNKEMEVAGRMKTLGILYLTNTEVTDEGLKHLTGLTNLTTMNLRGAKVTTPGVKRLMAALPNCKIDFDYDAEADPDRKIAEWVFSKGDFVQLVERPNVQVRDVASLPAEPVRLLAVQLQTHTVTDADLERFHTATCRRLYFHFATVTDGAIEKWCRSPGASVVDSLVVYSPKLGNAGVAHLANLPQMTCLGLNGTGVTDKGLEPLLKLEHLDSLYLANTAVTDEGLKTLARLPKLNYVLLAGTAITDEGLEHLAGLKELKTLSIEKTKVKPDGVKKLRERLPQCLVKSDFDKP